MALIQMKPTRVQFYCTLQKLLKILFFVLIAPRYFTIADQPALGFLQVIDIIKNHPL